MSYRLQSRRLYIADLARRLHEMESGYVRMQPLAYRLLSTRLRQAVAGLPEPVARAGLPELPAHLTPLVVEVLEACHFDIHGRLYGAWATRCRARAEALLGRLAPSARG
jgi:hypothetical protein